MSFKLILLSIGVAPTGVTTPRIDVHISGRANFCKSPKIFHHAQRTPWRPNQMQSIAVKTQIKSTVYQLILEHQTVGSVEGSNKKRLCRCLAERLKQKTIRTRRSKLAVRSVPFSALQMEDCPGTDLPAFYTTGTTIFWHQPALSTSSSKLVPWFKAFETESNKLGTNFFSMSCILLNNSETSVIWTTKYEAARSFILAPILLLSCPRFPTMHDGWGSSAHGSGKGANPRNGGAGVSQSLRGLAGCLELERCWKPFWIINPLVLKRLIDWPFTAAKVRLRVTFSPTARRVRSGIGTTLCNGWRSEATPTGELGGQEKPDWLGGQQPDERGSDEEVQSRKKPE
ncbi:hypothetical protein T4D_15524 [Trichinella pseudospiralis]|uniref:Uncharacterized protein n=1 Tax=Trichinella pseudospiralis TaxID=6337 RepID=A0A0V1FJQ0_TRIPS|nr:hypothetical protein T4D_15524 [Trichinella pseudospiralis]